VLDVEDLVVRYGAATAVDGASLRADAGEMVALVGPNGAGKTSIINAISGLVPTAAGAIRVAGRSAQVPEGRQMFADMSVEDNLLLGAWGQRRRELDPIYELFPDLPRLRRRKAGTLSGGQQQMVAVGRALMAKPELLLIDELSLGLAPLVVADISEHLQRLNRENGTTILLVEQEIALALRLCSRAYVLEAGRIVASGDAETLADDPALHAAYFGGVAEEAGASGKEAES
jgi:branched-chain amino acid transport system ATP-binding protein